MEQLDLIHESVRDATRSAIAALGGVKRVACLLRPTKEPDTAQRWLNNVLDDSRPEKLEIEDHIWIFREAKKIGYHAAMEYFARECEYAVSAIEPETELARLQREYINAVKALQTLTPKLEAVQTKLTRVA